MQAFLSSSGPPLQLNEILPVLLFRVSMILLKRDLMKGYKFYLYLDWMTFGIGTMIDIYGDGLYGMEEVQVSSSGRAVVGAAVPAEVRP